MLVVAEKARDVKGLRAQFAVRLSRFAGSESGVLRERAGTNKICHFPGSCWCAEGSACAMMRRSYTPQLCCESGNVALLLRRCGLRGNRVNCYRRPTWINHLRIDIIAFIAYIGADSATARSSIGVRQGQGVMCPRRRVMTRSAMATRRSADATEIPAFRRDGRKRRPISAKLARPGCELALGKRG